MKLKQEQRSKALLSFGVLLAVVAVIIYWRTGVEEVPGDYHVKKGNYRLEDGQHNKAVEEFKQALEFNPDNTMAHLGLAISYMQMGEAEAALQEFDATLALDSGIAVAYADKGILFDRLGKYEKALVNYKKALALDAEILEGPGWIWRFLHNIDKMPPTIKDRAAYLEEELAKPPKERLLQFPEEDARQQMYKVE